MAKPLSGLASMETSRKETLKPFFITMTPLTGEKLTPRSSPNRRPMYDCTFNEPKSVSLVHAITKDRDIMAAHRMAVQKTMAEIEENMQTQVGQNKQKHYEKTGNILWAEFVHTTTRPNEKELDGKKKYVPDPHLHTHATVINATWFEKEKRYRACEFGTIKRETPLLRSFVSFVAW